MPLLGSRYPALVRVVRFSYIHGDFRTFHFDSGAWENSRQGDSEGPYFSLYAKRSDRAIPGSGGDPNVQVMLLEPSDEIQVNRLILYVNEGVSRATALEQVRAAILDGYPEL